MQNLSSILLLLPLLLGTACDLTTDVDNQNSTDEARGYDRDVIRVELEVVGPGKITIVEPEQQECNSATPICSFRFPRGTEIVVEADFSQYPDGGWAEDCTGRERCTLLLDRDSLIVGGFGVSPNFPGPDIIVDPAIAPWDVLEDAPGSIVEAY